MATQTPETPASPEVVVGELPSATVVPVPDFTPVPRAQMYSTILEYVTVKYGVNSVTPILTAHLNFLDEYAQAMNPTSRNPIAPDKGAAYQSRLFNTMIALIGGGGPDGFSHTVGIDALLFAFFRDRNGAFNTRVMSRFTVGEKSTMPMNVREVFNVLTALCIMTCAPETRMVSLRNVSFATLQQKLVSYPAVMTNIAGFFAALRNN